VKRCGDGPWELGNGKDLWGHSEVTNKKESNTEGKAKKKGFPTKEAKDKEETEKKI